MELSSVDVGVAERWGGYITMNNRSDRDDSIDHHLDHANGCVQVSIHHPQNPVPPTFLIEQIGVEI